MKIGCPSTLRLAPIAAALGAAPLAAEAVSGTLAVTATVEESCHLHTRPLVFGAVASQNGGADAQSSLVLTCTPAASYVVSIDEGRHGGDGSRRMADAAGLGHLAYDLYRDAARTQRWGAHSASAVSAVAPASGRVELAVYARLAAGRAPAGVYADTVTVTVAF